MQKNPEKTDAISGENKKEDDNTPAPKGNGGRTDKYIWIQTLEVFLHKFRMWRCLFTWRAESLRRILK